MSQEQNQQPLEPEDNEAAKKLTGYTGGYLALPFDQEQFKDFVIGLLGRPQTIEKVIYGQFELNLVDIKNFHFLINQRLSQQNNALLIEFRAKIYFSDNSSVTLNSFEELVTYNEVRPIISVAVDLSWDYLIQFNQKDHPEKQGIDIRIWTQSASELRRRNQSREQKVVSTSSTRQRSFFHLEINYTARTWGTDMEALLTSHIESLINLEDGIKAFIRKSSDWIGLISAILFFVGALVGTLWSTDLFIKDELDKISALLNGEIDVSKQIFIIAQYIVSGETTRYYLLVGLFLLLAFIASIVVGIAVAANADNEKPSFLLLTQAASRDKLKKLQAVQAQWRRFIFSLIVALVTNIVASYLFAYLTQK